ncbi:MAG: NRDE family protein [Parahaliea sp.]
MCLIIFAYRAHPGYHLLMASNRDEFHRRPTAPAAFWADRPGLLAGRDLEAGGTWMGITRGGRFAAITNYRDPSRAAVTARRSRGELTLNWLTSEQPAAQWLARQQVDESEYAGFNLLFGDRDGLWYWSNSNRERGDHGGTRRLAPGLYGLSNASLDTPWPKVELGKAHLRTLLDGEVDHTRLLAAVADRRLADESALHPLGLREVMDRQLSAQFIDAGPYGTRSSTTLLWGNDGSVRWRELSYRAGGAPGGERTAAFTVTVA